MKKTEWQKGLLGAVILSFALAAGVEGSDKEMLRDFAGTYSGGFRGTVYGERVTGDGEIGLPPGRGRIRATVESRNLDEELRGYVTRVRCKARKVTYFGTARISAGPISVSGRFVARAFQRRNGTMVVRLPIFYKRTILGEDIVAKGVFSGKKRDA